MGCHFLLQGIFQTQGLNLHLCISCIGRRILYHQIAFISHTLIVQSLVVSERQKVNCLEQGSVIVDFLCQLDRFVGCLDILVQFSSVAQLCLTLCNPMDYSPPVSSVQGIFQERILEWVAISFSRGFSQPRDRTQVSCTAGGFFTL